MGGIPSAIVLTARSLSVTGIFRQLKCGGFSSRAGRLRLRNARGNTDVTAELKRGLSTSCPAARAADGAVYGFAGVRANIFPLI